MADKSFKNGDTISFLDLILFFWKKKIWFVIGTVTATVLAVFISYSIPETYKSSSVFMPLSSGGTGNNLSQISGLAAMAGINLSAVGGDESLKINTFLNSRSLKERVVKALDLVKLLELEGKEERDYSRTAVEALEKLVRIASGKNGEIILTAETKSPELSQKIANQYVIELENTLNEANLELSQKNMDLNERQLKNQSLRLRKAQESMLDFQTKNKVLDPSSQVRGYSEVLTGLYAQKIPLEVQLKQMENAYNPTDSRLIALKSQIDSIDKQISEIQNNQSKVGGVSFGEAPEQLIEYQNLLRDLEIASKLYSGLLTNLEQSRLVNDQEKIYIDVIDPPLVPEFKASPNRPLIVISGFFGGFFLTLIVLIVMNFAQALKTEYVQTRAESQPEKDGVNDE